MGSIRYFISILSIFSIIISPITLNNCMYHIVYVFKIFTHKGSKPVYSHMAEMRLCEVAPPSEGFKSTNKIISKYHAVVSNQG